MLMHRSHDSRNYKAGPSYNTYAKHTETGYDVQPSISPARHERSQSRMVLIEPRRTTTQTKIWLNQHYSVGMDRGEGDKGSMRSRSTCEGGEEKEECESIGTQEADQEALVKGMPFLIRPIQTRTIVDNEENGRYSENGGRAWLRPVDQATEWLSLFYGESSVTHTMALTKKPDLVVVAVLTVFSSTHELSSPSAIWIFLSYFTILAWLWTSQVHYDIRYQAEDVFHRCCKVFQIIVLVYMGAASGSWNPGLLVPVGDKHSRAYTRHGSSCLIYWVERADE
jgi:hypothetical protein